jgi:hypothetical protein
MVIAAYCEAREEHIMDDEHVTDPQENPVGTGHLPGSGEVGVGPVPRHDPVTADTDDNPDHAVDNAVSDKE